jgi:hypothetical protein
LKVAPLEFPEFVTFRMLFETGLLLIAQAYERVSLSVFVAVRLKTG